MTLRHPAGPSRGASSTEAPSWRGRTTGLGLDICMVTFIVTRALAGIHRRRSSIG
jgi:hypothetical protein